MQRELKVGLLLTALMAGGLLKAQTIYIYENSEAIFNMEADYWGEPVFEYSPDSAIWEGVDINLNEPFVVNEGMSGYYRLRMEDGDCDSSYISQVQVINVLPPPSTVTNPITGKIWMDRNLGASQVATSATDTAAYGDYYQWGRATTEFTIVTTSPYDWSIPQNDSLWQGVNGINNPCPIGFRIPTFAELWDEWASWSTNNTAGAFGSPLKLPSAGHRYGGDGLLHFVGSMGGYWTTRVAGLHIMILSFSNNNATSGFMFSDRADGHSVRCIKD